MLEQRKNVPQNQLIMLGHKFDFDNTKILEIEINTNKRLMLEMIHIKKKLDLCVNKNQDIKCTVLQSCNLNSDEQQLRYQMDLFVNNFK